MVLTNDQIVVIKNDYEEKCWTPYRIWREHPRFQCSRGVVEYLVKKIKKTGSAERRKGGGQPVTASTEVNKEEYEELILLQEDEPGTHYSVRKIAPHLEVSKSSVHRMVKRKKLNAFKRISTPQMIPFVESVYPRNDFIFIQDSAPSRRFKPV